MFSKLHTRRGTYTLVVWALVGVEGFFGWRAGLMYSSILTSLSAGMELPIIIVALSISLGVFGFFLATQRQQALEAMEDRLRTRQKKGYLTEQQLAKSLRGANRAIGWAIVFVILHDLAGAIWTTLHNVTSLEQVTIPLAVVTIGMAVLAVVPFLVGPATQALADGLAAERQSQLANEAAELTFGIQIGALRRKARTAQHQDPDAILNSPLMRLLNTGNLDETQRNAILDLQGMSEVTPPGVLPVQAEEPPNTITDKLPVVTPPASVPTKVGKTRSNGHKPEENGAALSRRPFRTEVTEIPESQTWLLQDEDEE